MTQKKDTVETERVKLVDWGYTVWTYEVSCKEVSLSRCYLVIASLQFYPFDKRERERWRESTIDEKEKACWAKVISWKGDKEREKKERKREKEWKEGRMKNAVDINRLLLLRGEHFLQESFFLFFGWTTSKLLSEVRVWTTAASVRYSDKIIFPSSPEKRLSLPFGNTKDVFCCCCC